MVGDAVLVTSRADVAPGQIGIEDVAVVEARRSTRFPGGSFLAASQTVSRLLDERDFNVVHDTFFRCSVNVSAIPAMPS